MATLLRRRTRCVYRTPDLYPLGVVLASIFFAVLLFQAVPGQAQPSAAGIAYLTGAQAADGSWQSLQVRSVLATAEGLRALQALGAAPSNRAAAVTRLETDPIEDTDDLSLRALVLAGEGRPIDSLATKILAGRDANGGWGLTPEFVADPLDSARALLALAPQAATGNDVLLPAFSSLISAQRPAGGWACVDSQDADSDLLCTSEALLALATYRGRFQLTPQIDAASGFLRGKLNPDGSFGTAGPVLTLQTAEASLALAAVSALGAEVPTVLSFLQSQQRPDGSWEGDPYTTAIVLRALQTLSSLPYCGDGLINRPGEACDGGVPSGVTCESLGLGPGTLTCSPQCTLSTVGCTAPPVCGDNLRNQASEVCDGTDLAAQTCQSQGFSSGHLACATDCRSFDVSGCIAVPTCGDGVVNQSTERCDLSDLQGATCESLGLGSGTLRCKPDCQLDTKLCESTRYIIDNRGHEFFVGFAPNEVLQAIPSVQLTSDVPTSVTVQYPVNNPSFSMTVTLTPGQFTDIDLPARTDTGWVAPFIGNNAVRLSGNNDFSVVISNRDSGTTDAALVLPVDSLGSSYVVTNYTGGLFLVVAPFDNTLITITPTTRFLLPDFTSALPGVPFQLQLNRGQGFLAETTIGELTGTLIESDKPVAVFNGNRCVFVPITTAFCDHLLEMAHPVSSWGTSVMAANLPNRPGGSIYRVVASVDGTKVSLDGSPAAVLNRGKFLDTGLLTGSHVFAGDHPIFVTQFMTGIRSPGAVLGDPSMVNVIPPEQYLSSYGFSTIGGSMFRLNFVTIIAPNASVGLLTLDGAPVPPSQFSPIRGTSFSSAVVPITQGPHATESPQPHGITVEGLDEANSYIFPGGARQALRQNFCGDGRANQESEECDVSDFRGKDCSVFGFSGGTLQCTVDCRIDTSQCSTFGITDQDHDGFPLPQDCNDLDPEVNPGMAEILGNGVDDDCNPATPDVIPPGAVTCHVATDRPSYTATGLVNVQAEIDNADPAFSLTGISTSLQILKSNGGTVFEETRALAPLPPGARLEQSYPFSPTGNSAGSYTVDLTLTAAGHPLAQCSANFTVEDSASNGAGLTGDLSLNPAKVNAGESSTATYTVRYDGNSFLPGIDIRVLLVDPASGAIAGELHDSTSLDRGRSYFSSQTFSTEGLASNKSYLATLLAKPAGADADLTLATAPLTVVNAPPDCSGAVASVSNLWPPNHKLVPVKITGVTDPDRDPITLTVTGVFQDERTDELGSGDTCPDAAGVGTPAASVRAERSGRQDGRVYHIFFNAEDGRGGKCESEVKVCVPHDGGPGEACIDEGALFDSTVCR